MKNFLIKHDACNPAILWAGDKTTQEIITLCHRGDWLLWLAAECNIDKRKIVLAAARCAATVKHLMKDPRSLKALEVAELHGLGLAAEEELANAANAAYAANANAASAAWAAANAAAAAWAAAASAAYAANAAAYAANAANAASAASAAWAAAAAAWASAAAAGAAADAAETQNQLTTANICREVFGEELLNFDYDRHSNK